jgi:hypothetical protein
MLMSTVTLLLPSLALALSGAPDAPKVLDATSTSVDSRCRSCMHHLGDAKTAHQADMEKRGLPQHERLEAFRKDIKKVFHKQCDTAPGEPRLCVHHNELAHATASVSSMNTYLSTDEASLCRELTNGTVCAETSFVTQLGVGDTVRCIQINNQAQCDASTSPYCSWGNGHCGRRSRDSGCHPSASTVELAGGVHARLDEVDVGTRIRTPEGFEPIIGFMHQEPDTTGHYYEFQTDEGSIHISAWHHLVVDGKWRDPATVVVGDRLMTSNGKESAVTNMQEVYARGAMHFFVPSGEYYVDGFLATDYDGHVPVALWHMLRLYARLRYSIGVPQVPLGHGKLVANPYWAFDAVDAWAVPMPVLWCLSPLLTAASAVSELLNVAAERPEIAVLIASVAALRTYKK